MSIKTDLRQLRYRGTLTRLANDSADVQLDNIVASADYEVTPSLHMTCTGTDRVVTVGSLFVNNDVTGKTKVPPPVNNSLPDFLSDDITIDVTGAGDITPTAGTPLALGMSASQYLKVGVAVSSTGLILLSKGTPAASLASATLPVSADDAFLAGYFVVRTDASNDVENILPTDIYQYSGAGGGGGGDNSFKLQSIASSIVSLKGGYIELADGRTVTTWDQMAHNAVNYGVDITLDLTSMLGSSPADATTYYLYIDLTQASQRTITDTGRVVYAVSVGADFLISTTTPGVMTTTNPNRYLQLGWIRSATTGNAWTGTGASFGSAASKKHYNGPAWDQSVAPEDGQALVFDSVTKKYKPGASGDASFKMQTLSANVATIKAGSIILDDGRELYLDSDLTINLKTEVNSLGITSPASDTTYYVYLDLHALPEATTVGDYHRRVYEITSGTSGQFVVLETTPEFTDLARYVPLYVIETDPADYELFSNLATRRHQKASVNASPLIYEDADHYLGTVGSVGHLATHGALSTSDFTTPSTAHVWPLTGNSNDANTGSAINLTQNGTPGFNRQGFFGRENLIGFNGGQSLSSTNAAFNVGNTAYSYGGWFKASKTMGSDHQVLIGNYDSNGYMIRLSSTGNLEFYINTTGTTVPVNFADGSWHHVVATYNPTGTLGSFYVDGQKVATASITNVTPTTNIFRIGARANTEAQQLGGTAQDCFFAPETLTDAQVNLIYSKRFKGKQLAGGHELTTDSFPLNSLTDKVVFYGMSSTSDGSGNSKTLADEGTVTFTDSDIFGAASCARFGSGKSLYSNDSFFTLGNFPIAFGGWFALDDWTPSAQNVLMSWSTTPASIENALSVTTDGNINVEIQADGASKSVAVSNPGFMNGSWHHIFVVAADGLATLYIDGVAAGTVGFTALTASSGTLARISGRRNTLINPMTGRADECCFIKNVSLTAADVRKIFSARLDLTSPASSVRYQDQIWRANLLTEDGLQSSEVDGQAFILDKSPTGKVWVDFGGATPNDSALRVNLKMFDSGLGASTVPVRKYDQLFTSAPSATIAHGLPSAPTSFAILHDADANGRFAPLDVEGYVKADGTNLYLTGFGALTIDGTHPLRIVACVGTEAIGVLQNDSPIAVSSAYTAKNKDKILANSTSGAFTITLPASPTIGEEIEIIDIARTFSTNNVTLGRNGENINGLAANYILNVSGCRVILTYTSTGWRVSGNVGEVIRWANTAVNQNLTTSAQDWTNATLTLTPGTWHIIARVQLVAEKGSVAQGQMSTAELHTSTNTRLDSGEVYTYIATTTSQQVGGRVTLSSVQSISASETYKIRVHMFTSANGATGRIENPGSGGGSSDFYAIRLA